MTKAKHRNDDPRQEHSHRTEPTKHKGEKGEPDVISDPALDEGSSGDWTSEGGATQGGPATTVSGKD